MKIRIKAIAAITLVLTLLMPSEVSAQRLKARATRQGFELMATAADGTERCVGYSDGGSFEQAMKHENFRQLMRVLEQQADETLHVFRPACVPESVEPLCSDTWDQFAPFNTMCPEVGGEHCAVGCVATAMSQVMRYHQWPVRGEGSFSYSDSTGCGQRLTADFSSHSYDWTHMLDRYDGDYSQREAEAVALLSSDCGVAVRMKYGVGSSGARCIYQPMAMAEHFGYDRGMQMYYRNFFTQAEWDSIAFTELAQGRPMLVGGWSEELAHAFVCDGYDERGFFHFRLGNPDGDGDGFFYFNWLTPDQPEWHDRDNPEGGLNLLQCITTGIQPRSSQPSAERYIFGFSHIEALQDGQIAVYDLSNLGWNVHPYRVGLALKRMDEPTTTASDKTNLVYVYSRNFLLEEVDDVSYSDTIALELPDVADGSYRLCPVYEQADSEGRMMMLEARTSVGTPNYLKVEKQGATFVVRKPTEAEAKLCITDVSMPDSVMRWSRPEFSFTVRNDGAEYSGRIYVALINPESPDVLNLLCEEGLSMQPGDSYTRRFVRSGITVKPGEYWLRIMADVDLFTDSLITLYEQPTQIITVTPYVSAIDDVAYAPDEQAGLRADEWVVDLSGRRVRAEEALRGHGIYLIRKKKQTVKIWK